MYLTYSENWWPVKYCIYSTRDRGVLSLLARGGGGWGGVQTRPKSVTQSSSIIQPFSRHARVTFRKEHFLTCQLVNSALF